MMTNREIGDCMTIKLDPVLPEYPKFNPNLRRAPMRDLELTDHEKKVAGLYIEGKSYRDIARILGKSRKSVDSALQRVKKKLENYVVSGM